MPEETIGLRCLTYSAQGPKLASDSYQALSVQVKEKKISYPLDADRAACELARRKKSIFDVH